MDINEIICSRIDELLRKKGITSYEATMRANLSENAIYYWRSKKSCPTIASLKKLLDAIGVSMGEFFSGIDNYDLTDVQKGLLNDFEYLTPEEQKVILELLKVMKIRRDK